jgi:lipopolysaccharide transport system permease protein
MNNQETWTEDIKIQNTLFSINFKEVWHYRDLPLMLVKRGFITFYSQTILGRISFFQSLITKY